MSITCVISNFSHFHLILFYVKIKMWINRRMFFILGCGTGVCWYMVPVLLPFSRSPLLTRLCSLPPLTALLDLFPGLSSTTSSIILLLLLLPLISPSINHSLTLSSLFSPSFTFSSQALCYDFSLFLSCLAELIYQCLHDFPLHLSNSQLSRPLPIKLSTLSTLHLFICPPQSCRCLFFALSSFSITKT